MKKEQLVFIGALVVVAAVLAFGTPRGGGSGARVADNEPPPAAQAAPDKVLVPWGTIGKQLVDEGVIDMSQLEALYSQRGGLSGEERALLTGEAKTLVVNEGNAAFALNVLWALGLANKSVILDAGPMQNYGDPGAFASTGGWTLAKGKAMDHYSRHPLVALTREQQELVERVSQNIYRPCCNNPAYFPDCNHGMAMLGFLELLASSGAGEGEMYEAAAKLNRMWFPEAYAAVDRYVALKGVTADARALVGPEYMSAGGFARVAAEVEPQRGDGGGCSV